MVVNTKITVEKKKMDGDGDGEAEDSLSEMDPEEEPPSADNLSELSDASNRGEEF